MSRSRLSSVPSRAACATCASAGAMSPARSRTVSSSLVFACRSAPRATSVSATCLCPLAAAQCAAVMPAASAASKLARRSSNSVTSGVWPVAPGMLEQRCGWRLGIHDVTLPATAPLALISHLHSISPSALAGMPIQSCQLGPRQWQTWVAAPLVAARISGVPPFLSAAFTEAFASSSSFAMLSLPLLHCATRQPWQAQLRSTWAGGRGGWVGAA